MRWPKLYEPDLPDRDLGDADALRDATAQATNDLRGHPDTVLEALPQDLAREESSALRRSSPRSRWREIDDLDRRVAELEQRGQAASADLQRLHEDRRLAPERDARRLADWIASGESGKRPSPSAPDLDCRIEEAGRERDALARAAADVLEEKLSYVEKHRKRLVREADSQVEKTARRYEQVIGELAAVRAELAAVRHAAVWASVYPARSAGAAPPNTIVGGRRKVLERASITAQVLPERLWELLRDDAAYLEHALTEEQAEELGLWRDDNAVWGDTAQGREAERKDKRAALARYRQEWGTEPV